MNDCVFCGIAPTKSDEEKVYEDENFVAFFSIEPVAEGHTILIPKKHYRWFYDMPDDEYVELFLKAKETVPILKDRFDAKYVKLGIVGTEVPHVHIHLIPRKIIDKDEPI